MTISHRLNVGSFDFGAASPIDKFQTSHRTGKVVDRSDIFRKGYISAAVMNTEESSGRFTTEPEVAPWQAHPEIGSRNQQFGGSLHFLQLPYGQRHLPFLL